MKVYRKQAKGVKKVHFEWPQSTSNWPENFLDHFYDQMKLINASVTNLKGLNLVSWNLSERYVMSSDLISGNSFSFSFDAGNVSESIKLWINWIWSSNDPGKSK